MPGDLGHGMTVASGLSVFHSTSVNATPPTPATYMHPHTRTLPPSVGTMHFSLHYTVQFGTHQSQKSLSHHSKVQSTNILHLCQYEPWQILDRLFLCMGFSSSFLRGWQPCVTLCCSVSHMVSKRKLTPVWLSNYLANCAEPELCQFSSTIRKPSWCGDLRGWPGCLSKLATSPSFLNHLS